MIGKYPAKLDDKNRKIILTTAQEGTDLILRGNINNRNGGLEISLNGGQLHQYETSTVWANALDISGAENVGSAMERIKVYMTVGKDAVLAKYGYHKIQFEKHSFFMIYRIDGNMVVVDGMYHELQDYETLFIRQMHLK